MKARRRRRAACAAVLSLALHVLALTGMVIGLKALTPPPEGPSVELRLLPIQEPQTRPGLAHRSPARRDGPRTTPRPPRSRAPLAAPLAAEPAAPPGPSGPGAQVVGEGKGLLPGFRGFFGCSDSTFRLTAEQHRSCAEDLARAWRNAPQLALDIPDRKKAEYDKYERCLKLQQTSAVPSLDPNDPASGAEVLPGGVVRGLGLGDPQGCLMGRW